MNTISHEHMGVLLHNRLKEELGIKLPKRVFVVGNCRPDYSIKYKRVPHYKEQMYPYIKEMIFSLAHCDKSRLNAYKLADQLGVVCHFLCDFFCYAHTDRFFGSLKDHFEYEMQLNCWIKKYKATFLQTQPKCGLLTNQVSQLFSQMESFYLTYSAQTPSYAVDMAYAFQACEQVLLPLLNMIVCKSQLSYHRLAEATV